MFVDLSGLLDKPGAKLVQTGKCDYSEWLEGMREQLSNPVPVTVTAMNEGNIIRVSLETEYTFRLTCDRCAEPVTLHRQDCFTHTVDAGNAVGDDLLELQNDRLEIDPVLWDDIFCALPTKILCRPDCKGLCLNCGGNLNDGDCGCGNPKYIL
ncbi:MAG: DUF177 domain-containing protein [Clostridia bacterium]|nr:DUF177 domain-containing protein [Clostridia bacterium]